MLHKLHLLRFMPLMGMVVTCFTLQAQEEPNDIWTLERCLEHALEHNIQIQQAELGIAQGELTKLAAVGAFLPNVNLSSFYSPPVGTLIGEMESLPQAEGPMSTSALVWFSTTDGKTI